VKHLSTTVFAFLATSTAALSAPAHAEAPALEAWGKLARQCEEPKYDFYGYRGLTGMHMAMYFAGAELDPRYELGLDLPLPKATPDEAAAAAGRAYLSKICDLDAAELMLAGSDAGDDLSALAEAAATMAVEMVTKTVGEKVGYSPFAKAGVYVPTRTPSDVYTAHLAHFAYDPMLATKIAPPPALDSDEYAESFNETKRVGVFKDYERTEDETIATVIFDSQDPHPMIFRVIAKRDLSLFEQARILAIYDMTTDDVTLAQFAGKLHFQSWRPVTAIRRADLDGREDTEVNTKWEPALYTPNSSEYPCGHCTFVSASAAVLNVILPLAEGEEVVITGGDMTGDMDDRGVEEAIRPKVADFEMRYESWDAFAEAGGLSRIHNGAHFRYSLNAGMALGKAVAKANLERWDGLSD